MTYAFVFDASSCTGCKACQVACKDKYDLPAAVLWRRVYEVTGGSWQKQGAAWTNTVFSSSLSLACNHCVHPKCAGVCPTDAYVIRPDGIVSIDTSKCTGCGYCAWACPYDAPVKDTRAGVLTKCDLCQDYLDQGMAPACVASCPMRCLDLVEMEATDLSTSGIALWQVPGLEHPFPLPKFSRTEPHLVIHPHISASRTDGNAQVANREEITPASRQNPAREEFPLVVFTLLTQMAVGALGFILFIAAFIGGNQATVDTLRLPIIAVGALILVAVLISFLHLGSPKNAWRMLNHLAKSWLSREILILSLWGGSWLILLGLTFFQPVPFLVWMGSLGVSFGIGLLLLFSEYNVYRLRSVPGWNTWRTMLEFSGSALCLGSLLIGVLLPENAPAIASLGIAFSAQVGFLIAGYVARSTADPAAMRFTAWRATLLLACLIGTIPLVIQPFSLGRAGMLLLLVLTLAEEVIGRWLFYARRKPNI